MKLKNLTVLILFSFSFLSLKAMPSFFRVQKEHTESGLEQIKQDILAFQKNNTKVGISLAIVENRTIDQIFFDGLKNIKELYIESYTKGLDLSKLTKLQRLTIKSWYGKSLTLILSPNLQELWLDYFNGPTTLTIKKLTKFQKLVIYGSSTLQTITLQNLPNLTHLEIFNCTDLDNLIVKKLPMLQQEQINFRYNKIHKKPEEIWQDAKQK